MSTAFGSFVNLATLPVVEPAGGALVQIDLSAAEMSGNRITVLGVDSAGDEWADALIFIDTPDVTTVEVFDTLTNDSTTVAQPDGSRILTIFEDDGTTVKARVQISEDGRTRTRLPLV
ncbi:MAG: hypothetical protein V3W41_14415 [Planctomycetota bacterium]